MENKNHFAWKCNCCDETWPTEEQRKEHEIDEDHYCKPCNRHFQSLNNIKMVRINMGHRVG